MSRSLRTLVIGAAVAVGAIVCVPAVASAAPIVPAAAEEVTLSTPPFGSTVAPGQVYSGTIVYAGVTEGDSIRLAGTPIEGGAQSACDQGVALGAGTVGVGGSFAIAATGTLPDGLSLIHVCHARVSFGGLYTMDNPFELRSPAPSEALPVDAPVLSGVGSPGSTVEATSADGTALGSAIVGEDGTWRLTLDGAAQGPSTITLTQGRKTIEAGVLIADGEESTPLIDPLTGAMLAGGVLALGAVAWRRSRAALRR
ncbi:hypothetical protein LLS1_33460 [Leifsonia sp. LS1]|uniref:Ig-like domain-containing protein n=1 Tax=Leifsonia sp. LS1 TaxID=2828483 RepID=UPI001CFED67F|nr:Ig-like domain-containing protein [Leifsonia sp. LS1]GIT81677.1 hypothetical protein LLS1_33460 [Leifsonia sp. LS1]